MLSITLRNNLNKTDPVLGSARNADSSAGCSSNNESAFMFRIRPSGKMTGYESGSLGLQPIY
jgi:hypothetical protein